MTCAYYIRANSKLLENAKQVFGDLVVEAYNIFDPFSLREDYTLERLQREWETSNTQNSFQIEGAGVVLEFINGNHVLMSCSEWADIKKVDIKDMVVK